MKVAFYTLGCKVNQYETDLMKEQFIKKGYEVTDFNSSEELADIYVVNSCSVTNLSTRKTRHYLSRAKRNNPRSIVILVGCYAQELKNDESNILPDIDIILGNEEKNEILSYVDNYKSENKENVKHNKVLRVSDINNVQKYVQNKVLEKGNDIRESIKIEDGCNNFCSYCIIPYLRGRVRSRSLDEIIAETKRLVEGGVKEVVLVGIEIASYGKDLESDVSLIDVIENISKIDGLNRIRLGSIEPRWLTSDNIERLSKISNLCNHFHISVQSLDNEVLKRMNRKYTREYIFGVVDKIKEKIKDAAFTCDIIVAFPGETDEEFENTMKGARYIGFKDLHVFKYSKRKFTRAAEMDGQVSGEIANKRSEQLITLGETLNKEYLTKYLGKKLKVLFESYSDGYLEGYTSNYIKVKVMGDKLLWGTEQEVELISLEKGIILGKF